MTTGIRDIAYYLPKQIITNDNLNEENPSWNMLRVEERAGVLERHISDEKETALDLAYEACNKLFSNSSNNPALVDAIIFCTQSEDYVMPPNSTVLHGKLGLNEGIFAVDINHACSGFVYGLALARGLLATGMANHILLINADTYSKYIHPKDRSARVLFGDGASATLVTNENNIGNIIDIVCATSGKNYDKFIIPAGGCRLPSSSATSERNVDSSGNVRTLENIHMDGLGVFSFFSSKVPQQIEEILGRNKLSLDDIDLFVFHQASKLVLDQLTNALKLEESRVFRNIAYIGNTVSASIPIALKDAMDQKRLRKGSKVLISGFGVGLSWGSSLLEII